MVDGESLVSRTQESVSVSVADPGKKVGIVDIIFYQIGDGIKLCL